jgi:bifunctional enzyme CysN/CysC
VDQFEAQIIWLDGSPMLPGRSYLLKCTTQTTNATINSLQSKLNVDTLEDVPGHELTMNEIGMCYVSTARALVLTPFEINAVLGSFILIDRKTNATVAGGLIRRPLSQSGNVRPQQFNVTKVHRAGLKEQIPRCFWLTGLSGSGKSTIANLFDQRLLTLGRHTYVLDGDNLRLGINRDLGFSDTDRVENVRRTAEIAKLMVDAGLIVIVSLISPFRSDREEARGLFSEGEFVEVFVDAPLAVCERRDPKGLYFKARRGQISGFTGLGSAYEPPELPDIRLETDKKGAEELVQRLVDAANLAS